MTTNNDLDMILYVGYVSIQYGGSIVVSKRQQEFKWSFSIYFYLQSLLYCMNLIYCNIINKQKVYSLNVLIQKSLLSGKQFTK